MVDWNPHHEDPPEEGSAAYGVQDHIDNRSLDPAMDRFWGSVIVCGLAGIVAPFVPAVHNFLSRFNSSKEGLVPMIYNFSVNYIALPFAGLAAGVGIGIGLAVLYDRSVERESKKSY